MAKMTTERMDAGFYRISYQGRTFVAETQERINGQAGRSWERWILSELREEGASYCEHLGTLAECKDEIQSALDTGRW